MTDGLYIRIKFSHGFYAGLDYARRPETVMSPVRLIYALIQAAHTLNGDNAQTGQTAFRLVDTISAASPPAIKWPDGVVSAFEMFLPRHLVGNSDNELTNISRVRFTANEPACVLFWRWEDFRSPEDAAFVRQNLQCLTMMLALIDRIGNSESIARVSLANSMPEDGTFYRPLRGTTTPFREILLRWTVPNIRAKCEAIYEQEKNLHYALPSRPVPYVKSTHFVMPTRNNMGEWDRVRLEVDPGVPLEKFEALTDLVHRALISCYDDPLVHGHGRIGPDGREDRSTPHIMLLPVAEERFVTAVDLVIPQEASDDKVDSLCNAITSRLLPRGLYFAGRASAPHRVIMRTIRALEPTPSCLWVTQTPYVTDRRIRRPTADLKNGGKQIAEAVRASCGYVGLPTPAQASFGFSQFIKNSHHSADFVRVRKLTREISKRPHAFVHLLLRWNEPIVAPPALGRCRYFGWGKLLPG